MAAEARRHTGPVSAPFHIREWDEAARCAKEAERGAGAARKQAVAARADGTEALIVGRALLAALPADMRLVADAPLFVCSRQSCCDFEIRSVATGQLLLRIEVAGIMDRHGRARERVGLHYARHQGARMQFYLDGGWTRRCGSMQTRSPTPPPWARRCRASSTALALQAGHSSLRTTRH